MFSSESAVLSRCNAPMQPGNAPMRASAGALHASKASLQRCNVPLHPSPAPLHLPIVPLHPCNAAMRACNRPNACSHRRNAACGTVLPACTPAPPVCTTPPQRPPCANVDAAAERMEPGPVSFASASVRASPPGVLGRCPYGRNLWVMTRISFGNTISRQVELCVPHDAPARVSRNAMRSTPPAGQAGMTTPQVANREIGVPRVGAALCFLAFSAAIQ